MFYIVNATLPLLVFILKFKDARNNTLKLIPFPEKK